MIVSLAEQHLRHARENSHRAASPLERFDRVRGETERLAASLSPEDQGLQSMPDASPAKWHRAHTTWFFETFVLREHARDYRVFDPSYNFLFNSYYEAIGPRHARDRRGLLSRPSAQEVTDYREHVDRAMRDLLAQGECGECLSSIVELGLQHEQQHQELLLTDILHAFAQNPLLPAYAAYRPGEATQASSAEFVAFDGGRFCVGHAGEGFAFDNELPRHETLLLPYRLMNRLVTNGEWLAFMADGGYAEAKLWLADGWQRACEEGWRAPLYWHERDGEWFAMTMSGIKPVERDAPVCHVSYYEADAFARWSGKRLPREAEWEQAASIHDAGSGNFRDTGYLRPLGAGRRQGQQFFGDVWEWTQSAYSPYPGYREPQGAVGEYNGKFMVNQMVLRGGSCVTSADHVRASYRNFFYPHQRWQFTGLRLADEMPSRPTPSRNELLEDVWAGLSAEPKSLPSKYFYDSAGSKIYEQICGLPEYYLTRTETQLLKELSQDLRTYIAPGTALVEFGCGASVKTRILLEGHPEISLYVPVDICEESLRESSQRIQQEFPRLVVRPIAGDFLNALVPPPELRSGPVLGFFPGSTIGNLSDDETVRFLSSSRELLGPNARFMIGIDLVKCAVDLVRAYDDAAGVTAAFNKNLLERLNSELGATFDTGSFSHRAIWNNRDFSIEMHLVSTARQSVMIRGRCFDFEAGETIHTENSRKYTLDGFAALAARAGWSIERSWSSSEPAYAVVLLH
ncbi:MAG TPA: ergothioneine biosynthesis protein EgtB [Rhizomicrobium sp.]|jgi:dimethylhistidine N-methyltransferase